MSKIFYPRLSILRVLFSSNKIIIQCSNRDGQQHIIFMFRHENHNYEKYLPTFILAIKKLRVVKKKLHV